MTRHIENKAFWQQHIERFKISGLSRLQYCQNNNLSYTSLGYHIRRSGPAVASKFISIRPLPVSGGEKDTVLCTLESQGYMLKIYSFSALSVVLDRMVAR